MSAARTRAAKPAAAVTAPEPETTAAAPAPAASTEDQAALEQPSPPVADRVAPTGADPAPEPETSGAAPAEPTEGETPSSAPAEGEPVPTVQDETTDAPAPSGEPLIIGVDYSSTADQTVYAVDGGEAGRSLIDGTVAVQAASNRAPYTRGGIHFASRRTPVVLPTTTTPDQVRRLVSDVAITLSLLHVTSGKSVELPRDLFGPNGEPDFDRLTALSDDLARQVVEAEGRA